MVSNDYIRGLFDGEGCVLLQDIQPHQKPRVQITNTCLELLLKVKDALVRQGYHPLLYHRKDLHFPLNHERHDLVLRRWAEVIRFYQDIGTEHPDKKPIFDKIIVADQIRPHCYGARGRHGT